MNDRYDWLAALTGLAFLVLAIVGAVIAGEPPDPSDDPVQEIIAFYTDNESELWIGTILQGLAATSLVFFGGFLRKVFRAAAGEGHMLSAVVLAGATIVSIAAAIDATINVALVESVDDIDPAAVQALSALWSNDFIPFAVGAQVFILAAGLSVVRHGGLPKWMGWIALVLGVIAVTPIGFVGFIGMGLWIGVVSVLLSLRARRAVRPAGPTTGVSSSA